MIHIPVEEVLRLHPYAMVLRREWFEFNGGAMFMLFHGGGAVFALDVEKKVVEKLMDCPPCMLGSRCEMIVPYEMDLSEFFAFQPGGLTHGNKPHI
ncbi:hypothetical protein PR202_ga08413 [Eleusine coracana subsp. coracana]|uniref:Uncharacterized protein n=1 Tax=Eleusine coracana subsp. coracana TaxID=191504 RepID=A0AAV5C258_ELECO|nr:hypothetical protein PR202_ga08413 [Eleusine coracana subsp. coracana]